MNKPDIVIKDADKGGVVTVLSKNHYRTIIYEHLSNQNTYQNWIKIWTPLLWKKYIYILNKQENIFTDKEFKYINQTD